MHPFWLTFRSPQLEEAFLVVDGRRKWRREKSCLLMAVGLEVSVLMTVMLKSHGVAGAGFWAHLVCTLLPQVLGMWLYCYLSEAQLQRWRTCIISLSKMSYTLFALWASTFKNPSPGDAFWHRLHSSNHFESFVCRWMVLPVLTLVVAEVLGNLMPALGLTLKFKYQFLFQIMGCAVSICEQHNFFAKLFLYREEGKAWVASVTQGLNSLSHFIVGLDTWWVASEESKIEFPCLSLLAFLQTYLVGFVCLSFIWADELQSRSRFLLEAGGNGIINLKTYRNEQFLVWFPEESLFSLKSNWMRIQLMLYFLYGVPCCWYGGQWLCKTSLKYGWLQHNEVW